MALNVIIFPLKRCHRDIIFAYCPSQKPHIVHEGRRDAEAVMHHEPLIVQMPVALSMSRYGTMTARSHRRTRGCSPLQVSCGARSCPDTWPGAPALSSFSTVGSRALVDEERQERDPARHCTGRRQPFGQGALVLPPRNSVREAASPLDGAARLLPLLQYLHRQLRPRVLLHPPGAGGRGTLETGPYTARSRALPT